MGKDRRWLLIVATLVVLGIAVGTMSWWLPREQVHSRGGQSTLEHVPSPLPTSNVIEEADESISGPESPIIIDSVVEEERERASTVEDLIRRGLPPSPNHRKEAIEWTANRSLEGVAHTLDDAIIMNTCRSKNVLGIESGMVFWASSLPQNVLVLRLIEEGREDPDRVVSILKRELTRRIEQLETGNQSLEHATERKRYIGYAGGDPWFAIAGAFYVLANIDIDCLNDPAVLGLLARWIVPPEPSGPTPMKMWLVDHCFRSTDASSSPHAAAHLAIVGDRTMKGPKKTVSKWSAAWGRNDPLIRMLGVDASDLETIEVLNIPTKHPFTIEQNFKVQENFRKHINQLRAAGTLAAEES